MQLAVLLGRSLSEIEAMPTTEFELWRAFDLLNPINHAHRAELSAAIIAQTIHACATGKSRPASEFMVDWQAKYAEPEDPIPVANLASKVLNIFAALGITS